MKSSEKKHLDVKEFYDRWGKRLNIKLIAGRENLSRKIKSVSVQKPGLRIIEPEIKLDKGKIQVLGKTEIDYLDKADKKKREKILKFLSNKSIPCFIFTKGFQPKKIVLDLFIAKVIPIFKTKHSTGKLILEINEILAEYFAPIKTIHGVLIDIHRLGVLIIGKSECALDLIIKGAKLITDDVVKIQKISNSKLIGTGPENIKYLMEIRGIGIVNIKNLFGTTSVMDKREIDMVIELDHWDTNKEYERLGIETKTYSILDLDLPFVVIPVSPGRNISTIIEVAVRNQILRRNKSNIIDDKNILDSGFLKT